MSEFLNLIEVIIPGSMIGAIAYWCLTVYVHAYKCYKGKI